MTSKSCLNFHSCIGNFWIVQININFLLPFNIRVFSSSCLFIFIFFLTSDRVFTIFSRLYLLSSLMSSKPCLNFNSCISNFWILQININCFFLYTHCSIFIRFISFLSIFWLFMAISRLHLLSSLMPSKACLNLHSCISNFWIIQINVNFLLPFSFRLFSRIIFFLSHFWSLTFFNCLHLLSSLMTSETCLNLYCSISHFRIF